MPVSRRRVLQVAGVSIAPAVLVSGGCSANPAALGQVIDPAQIELPLVIDTHAHVFNATDLQVRRFISTVAVNEVESSMIRKTADLFGTVLQWISWQAAPSAEWELRALGVLEQAPESASLAVSDARATQYRLAKQALEEAAGRALMESGRTESAVAGALENLQPEDQALASLLSLPETYERLHDDSLESPLESMSFSGIIKFLVEMFQYRHVSAANLFNTYASEEARIDLATPSIVDFDWWLANGRQTESPIPQQIQVAEQMARLSGGAVHPIVPFCPLRQALYDDLDLGDYSPLAVVRDAVERKGAVGVKLYPPMGFAIYGNARFADNPVWLGIDRLHEYSKRPGFAQRLDEALDQLFSFCAESGVAVMAHSSRSNMAAAEYEPLLFAESWSRLFDQLYSGRKLTGSFGHFSGFGSDRDPQHWEGFVALLREEDGLADRHRFADLSYFTETLTNSAELSARLRGILFDGDQPTSIFDQLLYGSDWKMLLMERDASRYLSSSITVLRNAEAQLESVRGENLLAKALGLNALEYLGLRKGDSTRRRLENFYDREGVAEPMWMRKADRA